MSLLELARKITVCLRNAAQLSQQLHDGMVQKRTAWIAARPSELQEPALALEPLAAELRRESAQLQELFATAGAQITVPGVAPALLHVDASLLAARLPALPARELLQAANAATTAARALRREHALGERLLRFSQHAHEQLLASIAAATAKTAVDVGGYDRTARRVAGALPGCTATPGHLVDGRM